MVTILLIKIRGVNWGMDGWLALPTIKILICSRVKHAVRERGYIINEICMLHVLAGQLVTLQFAEYGRS